MDLLKRFQEYLRNYHGVDIEISWKELGNFSQVGTMIENAKEKNVFGISSFSILENRKKHLNFSPPYLKDISIIASHNTTPSVNTKHEFLQSLNRLKALTLLNSPHEKRLLNLKTKYGLQFEIEYMKNSDDIVSRLSDEKDFFGYLHLANYFSNLNEGRSIKRHNFFPIVAKGYAIAYPTGSDWGEPLEAYFNRVSFQFRRDKIITKYLGMDVLNLIDQIDSNDSINISNEIGLLNKEKEIQATELNKATLKQAKHSFYRNLLTIGLLSIIIVATVLLYNNRQKAKINEILLQQQQRIEEQQEAIENQNKSLVVNNKKLKKLNKQKNNLIGVLSHDLRTPINQIKGFAKIYKMENKTLSEDKVDLINRIISTSDRLIKMIRKVMDVEAIDATGWI